MVPTLLPTTTSNYPDIRLEPEAPMMVTQEMRRKVTLVPSSRNRQTISTTRSIPSRIVMRLALVAIKVTSHLQAHHRDSNDTGTIGIRMKGSILLLSRLP
jgi:hypothetical protein